MNSAPVYEAEVSARSRGAGAPKARAPRLPVTPAAKPEPRETGRIPVPARVLWREFRIRVLPFLIYLAGLALVLWLWL